MVCNAERSQTGDAVGWEEVVKGDYKMSMGADWEWEWFFGGDSID